VATVLGVVLLVLLGWLLLLAYLLLRRSRIAWLFTVATAVSGTAGPSGLTSVPVDVVGRALGLAIWLPLLTPSALRWFWRRPRVSDWSYGTSVPDLRRSD
jgi:asparagine N-glycosylation enzyme membrane subunit Stt3